MFQINKELTIEITEKKSRFITRIFYTDNECQIKELISNIIKKEKGAVHNCYAYRILGSNNQILEKKNDDGEPGGTAGAPMLSILAGEDLINILAVTTRYFGGIKLGTGGLVRVYKRGVREAVDKSGKKAFEIRKEYNIKTDIKKAGILEHILNKENIKIKNKIFNDEVVYFIEASDDEKNKLDILLKKINVNLTD